MASEHIEVPLELMTNAPVQETPSPQVEGAPTGGEVPTEMVAKSPTTPRAEGDSIESPLARQVVGGVVGGALGSAVSGKRAVANAVVAPLMDKHARKMSEPIVEVAKNALMPGTERWKKSANEISEAAKKVVQDTNIRGRAPQFTRQEWKMGSKELTPMAEMMAKLGPYAKFAGRYVNPVLGGAMAGAQGLDAYERLGTDPVGAAIGGLGALAGGTMAAFPPATPIAMPISIATELMNLARDNPEAMVKMLGGNVKAAPKMFANGGAVGYAEGQSVKKPRASIAGTLNTVGTVQGPNLASMMAEHLASLPQKTENNLRHQQDVMNRAMPVAMNNGRVEFNKGDPEAIREMTDMVSGVGGITSIAREPISRVIQEFDKRFDPRVLEQAKLKNLVTKIEQYQNPNIPKVSLTDFEGHPFITSMSDRTAAGGHLTGINNVNLNRPIELMGGQDYMFNNPGQVWASAPGPVKQLMKQAQGLKDFTGKDPLYLPWRMAPTGGDFAHMTGETMLSHADSALEKADKKALNAAMKELIPDWKGLGNPESVNQFRKAPSAVRKNVQNMIDKDFRELGALGIGEARLAVADPRQLNAPEGGIQNIGRIFADKPIIQQSGHASYPQGIPGEGLGVIDVPRNIFELMPNAVQQRGIANPMAPSQQDIRALQMKPYSGIIDAKLLKALGL